jgi:hypothetical protein
MPDVLSKCPTVREILYSVWGFHEEKDARLTGTKAWEIPGR